MYCLKLFDNKTCYIFGLSRFVIIGSMPIDQLVALLIMFVFLSGVYERLSISNLVGQNATVMGWGRTVYHSKGESQVL